MPTNQQFEHLDQLDDEFDALYHVVVTNVIGPNHLVVRAAVIRYLDVAHRYNRSQPVEQHDEQQQQQQQQQSGTDDDVISAAWYIDDCLFNNDSDAWDFDKLDAAVIEYLVRRGRFKPLANARFIESGTLVLVDH